MASTSVHPCAVPWSDVIARITRGGFYQPDPDGVDSLIIAVRAGEWPHIDHPDPRGIVRYGDVVDLIATPIGKPHKWAVRVGASTHLGSAPPQFMEADAVSIWRTPLAWVLSGGEGLCFLTDDRRIRQNILLQLHNGFLGEDLVHARSLRDVAQTPLNIPPVLVRMAAAKEAA